MIFLRAEWRHVAMLNYAVEAKALAGLVPRGTELDEWQGTTYLSVVGFLFLNTRVLGLPIPFHRHFEEVNLRFYVRRKADEGWRRGVVFVKEIVPRAAIAFVARALYNEKYVALPMAHAIRRSDGDPSRIESVSYQWATGKRTHRLQAALDGEPRPLVAGSHEEFIAEHYWGYSIQRDGGTSEYHVQHPPWRVASASRAELDCDVAGVYGDRYVPFLTAKPVSAFVAEGSEVSVAGGVRLS